MSIYGLIGVFGAGLYLTSYALLQLGLLRGNGYPYTLLNLTAAGFVAISLLDAFNLSTLIIQAAWIVISIVGLIRKVLIDRMIRMTAVETKFHHLVLPDLSRAQARRLLKLGSWETLPKGAALSEQGVPVPYLIYTLSGTAEVFKDMHLVAHIRPGHFIGEITCLEGVPATASVTATSTIECFRIPAEKLRCFVDKNEQYRGQLDRAFAADMRAKLTDAANYAISLKRPAVPA